jgi:hypothetical protein
MLDKVRFRKNNDVRAHKIMVNGDIIQPLEFKPPSRWFCRLKEVRNYEFGAVNCGIRSIRNFITDITCEEARLGKARFGQVRFGS